MPKLPRRWPCWRMWSSSTLAFSSTDKFEFSITVAPSAICSGDVLRPESFLSRRWSDSYTPSWLASIFIASKSRLRRRARTSGLASR